MRKLLIILAAVAALALPAAASAHGFWWHHDHALFAKLSGTGTSFGGSSSTASGQIVAGHVLSSGTFTASVTTDWTQSTTKTGEHGTLVCAPASLSLTLTDSASSAVCGVPAEHPTRAPAAAPPARRRHAARRGWRRRRAGQTPPPPPLSPASASRSPSSVSPRTGSTRRTPSAPRRPA